MLKQFVSVSSATTAVTTTVSMNYFLICETTIFYVVDIIFVLFSRVAWIFNNFLCKFWAALFSFATSFCWDFFFGGMESDGKMVSVKAKRKHLIVQARTNSNLSQTACHQSLFRRTRRLSRNNKLLIFVNRFTRQLRASATKIKFF